MDGAFPNPEGSGGSRPGTGTHYYINMCTSVRVVYCCVFVILRKCAYQVLSPRWYRLIMSIIVQLLSPRQGYSAITFFADPRECCNVIYTGQLGVFPHPNLYKEIYLMLLIGYPPTVELLMFQGYEYVDQ